MRTYNATAQRLRELASFLDSGGDPDLVRIKAEGPAEQAIIRADDHDATVSRFVD